jgi:serine/threonine-protein kinase
VEPSFAAGLVGIVLDGRYRLDALLGEGGMGAVYRATQLANDRRVAVKLLKPHLTNDDAALERFMREARSTLKVESPHAVKVLDFGITPHRDYYMVLEYLDGRTVQRELDVDGAFAPARVVHIARQALHALGAAHAQGIVHRDIKPDNILLMRAGDDPDYAKVLDFGVAKLLDQSVTALTAQGMVFGTPEFMSPEQATGQRLDGRSDLYSLAACMYAMLTGCGLYPATTPIEWLTSHARVPAPHLDETKPELAAFRELDELLQRCLAKNRDLRPATAEEMAAQLAALETTLRRPTTVKAATTRPVTVFSQSTYIAVLPSEPVEVPVRSRRGLWFALGGLAIAGLVTTAIAFASRDKPVRQPPPVVARVPVDAAVVRIDAAPPPAVTIDAAPPPPVDAVRVHTAPQRPRLSPEAERHLAAAETARRARKWMAEIEEAHAVLRIDPHNVKATLLLADGLFNENDIPQGCKYLHSLGSNPLAVARAKQAGCSAD